MYRLLMFFSIFSFFLKKLYRVVIVLYFCFWDEFICQEVPLVEQVANDSMFLIFKKPMLMLFWKHLHFFF